MRSKKSEQITESLMPLRPEPKSGSRWGLSLLLLIIALIVAGFGLYMNLTKDKAVSNTNKEVPAGAVVFATPTQAPIDQLRSVGEITEWDKFSSKYLDVSFEYPSGYDVHEIEGSISVSEKKYQEYEVGRDNAFFRLVRFNQNITLANENVLREGETKTAVTLDGQKFTAYTAIDKNSCEGAALGEFTRIILTRSEIVTQQYECGVGGTDYSTAIEHILSTFKFSK